MTELTSKAYARDRAATIDTKRATKTGAFGGAKTEGVNTTHYSVVDEHGNSVATTTTLNDLYGSGVYVAQGGFFLNDEMDDFAARPGQPNMFGLVQGEQNAIAPGKRMLSAMSPTIVVDPKGNLFMVIGSRGGPRIITSVAQVIVNVIDHHMTFADAMSEPRIHHQAWPDQLHYEPNGLSFATVDSLRMMGHAIEAATFAPGGYVGTRDHWIGRVDDGMGEAIVDPTHERRATAGLLGAVGRVRLTRSRSAEKRPRACVRASYLSGYSLWICAGAFRWILMLPPTGTQPS